MLHGTAGEDNSKAGVLQSKISSSGQSSKVWSTSNAYAKGCHTSGR